MKISFQWAKLANKGQLMLTAKSIIDERQKYYQLVNSKNNHQFKLTDVCAIDPWTAQRKFRHFDAKSLIV